MIIGIGTDLIEVKRISDAIERYGDRFLKRIFTPVEIEYCSARKAAPLHYAGRFAAKEAAFKAMRKGWTGELSWKEIEIYNESSGAPFLNFYGKALALVREKQMTTAYVTITHIEQFAAAVVVLEA